MRRVWGVAAAFLVTMGSSTGGDLRPTAVPPPSPCPSAQVCHAVLGDDPSIVVRQGPFYSDLMPLTARLEWRDDESCLLVHREDLSGNRLRTLFPVWPEGARPLRAGGGKRGLALPGAGRILDGDLFQAGGTSFPLDVTPPIPGLPTFHRPPGDCSTYDGYFVFDDQGISRVAG